MFKSLILESDGSFQEVAGGRSRRHIARPSVPLIFFVAAVIWGGMFLSEYLMWEHFTGGFLFDPVVISVVCLGIAAILFAFIFYLKGKMRCLCPALFLLAILSISLSVGMLYWNDWENKTAALEAVPSGLRCVEVVSDAHKGEYGYYSYGVLITKDDARIPLKLNWSDESDIKPCGTTNKAYGCLSAVGFDDGARYAHKQGRCGSMTVNLIKESAPSSNVQGLVAPLRDAIKNELREISGEGSALIEGVLLGDQNRLEGTTTENAFRLCGLSHLIAVSGGHLVVVSALLGWFLERMRFPRVPKVMILIIVLIFYVFLSGIQISAVRACVMTAIGSLALVFGRRKDSLSSCSFCVTALLLLAPETAFSFSFQLSAVAIFGIVIFSAYFTVWLSYIFPGFSVSLAEPVALTLAAQITTLPLTLPLFAAFPVLLPLANLIVSPLVTVLLSLGILVSCGFFIFPLPISDFLFSLISSYANGIVKIVQMLSEVPHVAFPSAWSQITAFTVFGILCLALWILWPSPTKRLASLCVAAFAGILVALFFLASLPLSPRLTVLDVGQGDSILVQSGQSSILIDTGDDNAKLLAALARQGVTVLDAVVITHLHSDHYAALASLKGTVEVGKVLFAKDALTGDYASSEAVVLAKGLVGEGNVLPLEKGDRLSCDLFIFEVLSPSGFSDEGENQDSLCFDLTFDDDGDGVPESSTFLSGDAESETLQRLRREGILPDVDIYKVGHHGSLVAMDEADLKKLSPRVALISVGVDNEYGHPAESTLALLEDNGVNVFRTDRNGDIQVRFCDSEIKVSCATMSVSRNFD